MNIIQYKFYLSAASIRHVAGICFFVSDALKPNYLFGNKLDRYFYLTLPFIEQ